MQFEKITQNLLELNINEIPTGYENLTDEEIEQDELYLLGENPNVIYSKKAIDEILVQKPNIYYSTSEPTAGIGNTGDLWVIYEE